MPCDKHKEKKRHVYSKKQAGFFGAVAAGKAKKKTSMTKAQARHHLRGEKLKDLPERSAKKHAYKKLRKKGYSKKKAARIVS